MTSKYKGKSAADLPDITRAADPGTSTSQSKMDLVSNTLFAPFTHKKKNSSRILTDREHYAFCYHPFKPLTRCSSSGPGDHDSPYDERSGDSVLTFARFS
jgi:hypothetical protein